MFIVLTRDVFHPESQEYLFSYGDILSLDTLTELHEELGIDETLGHFCMTEEAAKRMRSELVEKLTATA
jgi:hypothetical protein